jgi:hypothetical protein
MPQHNIHENKKLQTILMNTNKQSFFNLLHYIR